MDLRGVRVVVVLLVVDFLRRPWASTNVERRRRIKGRSLMMDEIESILKEEEVDGILCYSRYFYIGLAT
jgi:hypothetical protein